MSVVKSAHLAVITVFLLVDTCYSAPPAFKLCGRQLVETMEGLCKEYNSPPWDVPTVIEQPTGAVRRKRQMGIADRCCVSSCRATELLQYCSVIKLESPLELTDEHLIEDRSAEASSGVPAAVVAKESSERRSVRGRSRGYAKRGRCSCRRKRAGRRRSLLMGNMKLERNAARAAPVVGTVSPLLTWGRTLNTDLPSAERDRYAYIAVYS
ncbi:unnamed protein product [Pieris macdunnoughi]|uniref:Insulin-like domain-containing protein n=1 Tax=Pieris macdunnoughi TaxID=345717 RepID=A0A821X4W6_9NEOP|nr:unnamed protein product [Pieris macdunnoughi]